MERLDGEEDEGKKKKKTEAESGGRVGRTFQISEAVQ